MIEAEVRSSRVHRLEDIWRTCPELRFGQLVATVGLLGEDATGRTLWDLEDEQLVAALEHFADDLARRTSD